MNKEHNFISVIVHTGSEDAAALSFFETLNSCLSRHFLRYEIIITNCGGLRCTLEPLRAWAQEVSAPVTLINMSLNQAPEQCMNAGLDIAIGDYVCEFDIPSHGYDMEILFEAYQKCMSGYDIVTVAAPHMKFASRLFYQIFNRHSHSSSQLRTDVFRLVSRRAINRVHAVSEHLPYRKAAYAASGLKAATIVLPANPIVTAFRNPSFSFAVDSLILYTDFGYKFSFGLSLLMCACSVAEVIYTVVIWLMGIPINGWTTTMFAITFGFTCVLTLMTIMLKYLTLLIDLVFRKQKYLIESVQKL